ncbi:alpha/beta hydrolase [Nocardia rhizosphaerihabitans]|uniref:alpha/beta hydrolase n=1 Tax=Nocardia rhizosphaerihabitans TaxID=1691570 RepID=UPI00366EA890
MAIAGSREEVVSPNQPSRHLALAPGARTRCACLAACLDCHTRPLRPPTPRPPRPTGLPHVPHRPPRSSQPSASRSAGCLRVTHEGEPSRNTVLGHSYGTTVVGLSAAEERTLDADTVVLVASSGAGVDSARDLSLTGVPDGQQCQHVFSTRAENDPTPLYENLPGWIPGVDRHGEDPTEIEFGGQVFTSDPGTRTPVVEYSGDSHSEYWEPGSTSLVNMGHIIAGNPGKVTYE